MPPTPAAVLISGTGSNFVAIANAVRDEGLPLDLKVVIADRAGAAGLDRARERGIPALAVPTRDYPTREAHEAAVAAAIDASGASLVVLAGYLRIFSASFTARYAGRMLNLHPSLLPAYPGLHTHERALAAGDAVHGTSIHFVTAELDGGPLIAQARLTIAAGDTPETLGARVRAAEHRLYPLVLRWVATGRLALVGGRVHLDGLPLAGPVVYALDRTGP